ncbi:MAG TPA: AraC family transcriptional regulator, partial [Draconibacterium sp.]|nr:AraC family transcriptional regulator [Draconibacterium sp.]
WVVIKPRIFKETGEFEMGDWSRFKPEENKQIGQVLAENTKHTLQKANVLKTLFMALRNEVDNKGFGYYQRICNLTEELLINTVRIIQSRENQIMKNQNWFLKFDEMLGNHLSKKWTLEEMASRNGVGITTLTQLVKEQTGYTPANYLIFLRLEKAKQLLVSSNIKLTDIAFDCGFYSSQHFSSTFSKWVGKTPLFYRKLNSIIKEFKNH